jgi:hypothetical protein
VRCSESSLSSRRRAFAPSLCCACPSQRNPTELTRRLLRSSTHVAPGCDGLAFIVGSTCEQPSEQVNRLLAHGLACVDIEYRLVRPSCFVSLNVPPARYLRQESTDFGNRALTRSDVFDPHRLLSAPHSIFWWSFRPLAPLNSRPSPSADITHMNDDCLDAHRWIHSGSLNEALVKAATEGSKSPKVDVDRISVAGYSCVQFRSVLSRHALEC